MMTLRYIDTDTLAVLQFVAVTNCTGRRKLRDISDDAYSVMAVFH